jgi:hypothetical protein
MSNLESIITLEYKSNKYTVAKIIINGEIIPLLFDRDVYKAIKTLNKKWHINERYHIYCFHQKDGDQLVIYLHEIVMQLNKKIKKCDKPIIHINNIHFDNRFDNLQYDTLNKSHSKNIKKKKRTIDLSEHGIDVDLLPTYLWYVNPDSTHGSRFIVQIKDHISWRSTASKKVSVRYKLEEAKKYLRYLKKTHSELFDEYSMNGDLTKHGQQLYKEYCYMIRLANFSIDAPNKKTDNFLALDKKGLNDFELYLLNKFNPSNGLLDINLLYAQYYDE